MNPFLILYLSKRSGSFVLFQLPIELLSTLQNLTNSLQSFSKLRVSRSYKGSNVAD